MDLPVRTTTADRAECAHEGHGRVRSAEFERLVALRRRYEPSNLFRLNHDIPPA